MPPLDQLRNEVSRIATDLQAMPAADLQEIKETFIPEAMQWMKSARDMRSAAPVFKMLTLDTDAATHVVAAVDCEGQASKACLDAFARMLGHTGMKQATGIADWLKS